MSRPKPDTNLAATGSKTEGASAEQALAAILTDVRKPLQPRSQASLDRMLTAAKTLMIERGGEDFTLHEVSSLGKVSTGSIYHRFEGKDELIRAVIGRELAMMGETEERAFADTLSASDNLDAYIPGYVRAFSQILLANALMLRLAMRRASVDPEVSRSGSRRQAEAAAVLAAGLAHYRQEIRGHIETKALMVVRIIFATLVRQLSIDSMEPVPDEQDWETLLRELGEMVLTYLKFGEDRTAG
ncbi:TetR/AcrR family transcriptional regulator [Novosphingobium sp. KN65.2]|uniref:TetR/AcrR family transcriptional regulator n=1 Tax=Novosphingobium sp. KN65.2 TaxID=1478134 RepID=UPI0005E81BFF|nr:TetR/AcrR family transcriptional regulator [Novosphingobium sp. KN65.2]CDO37606.1 Transcriptional regulator, TetR family [Novosphingobium sp. KN65.2]